MIHLRHSGSRCEPSDHAAGQAIGDAVRAARARLVAAGIGEHEAALDAASLTMQVLHCDRASLLTRDRESIPPGFHDDLELLLRRREAREPMAYIRGSQEFWGRDFIVSSAVLIPRPETELIVEEALRFRTARDGADPLIVDVGTGSGCLAVTLACEWPDARIVATDVSDAALDVARENARRHQVERRIRFVARPYLAEVDEPIDLIVANPPYVAESDQSSLQPEVRLYEPHTALFGGVDGLRDVRAILQAASTQLTRDGRLLVEIGLGQADALRAAVLGTPSLSLLDLRADLQGIPRVAICASGLE